MKVRIVYNVRTREILKGFNRLLDAEEFIEYQHTLIENYSWTDLYFSMYDYEVSSKVKEVFLILKCNYIVKVFKKEEDRDNELDYLLSQTFDITYKTKYLKVI